ncbi:MAG: MarR family transcriptional regulator [Candidatus Nitrosotenuis sp.]
MVKSKAVEKDSKKDDKKLAKEKPAKLDKKTAKLDKKAAKLDKKIKDKAKEKIDKKAAVKEEKRKKKEEESEKTLEEQLEEELTDEEIENFQIDKVDMEKLTNRVCLFLANYEDGIVQSELWKKFKLTSRDSSRLALKLERMGIITREKILENKRWTYVLKIKKTPVSTDSIENAPCLVCPVEQKCSLDGEVSPRTCQWIEDWTINDLSKPKKKKEQ